MPRILCVIFLALLGLSGRAAPVSPPPHRATYTLSPSSIGPMTINVAGSPFTLKEVTCYPDTRLVTTQWTLSVPNLVAKQFRPYHPTSSIAEQQQRSYALQAEGAIKSLGQEKVIGGESGIIGQPGGDSGEVFAWLIYPNDVKPAPAAAAPPQPQSGGINTIRISVAHSPFILKQPITDPGSFVTKWTLTDPAWLAKQFQSWHPDQATAYQQQRAFIAESSRANAILGQNRVVGGESQIIGGVNSNQQFAWLIVPSTKGGELTTQPGWTTVREKGRRACTAFLSQTVRKVVANKLLADLALTNLIHLDPSPGITVWTSNPDRTLAIEGFTDFEKMDTLTGPMTQRVVRKLWPGEVRMDAQNLAARLAQELYPDSLCPPAVTAGFRPPGVLKRKPNSKLKQ